ncbi:MAG TPA: type II toxin-antitoxin system HicA family toxin [Phycisphaerae bacterium]|jgi:predicted RNA binding protein YcfA (HicA-like mRNA interferase family)|nr:addiction module toxin, HicA family [Phycisphaerae bacterium]HOB73483.1 type II toxin-antitoxin system HicA family toxin [Phycisphaerae bacterium]HOJ54091.1 type II toxin-antitoxin system HicA family toxin [Phycisphaerae bacterium]HOL25616.1 type II toxin-antitoxin system HicA family toxin [Phycisphaerae bacterium]HPP22747.1 type II toxin-antitoxin system HicA family toxin [Phycisphaerae bacterium]
MSRLPSLKPREVIAALQRAGFEILRQTGSHVHLRHPVTRRRTLVAVHPRELHREVLKEILKQAGLTEDELRSLL